ncbi:MAG: hypothetical protein WD929_06270 [Steroidobacteraceae bacterium]
MSTAAFIDLHVVISLLAIASGLVVCFGLLTARRMPACTAFFLATTWLTSITGFMLPFVKIGPPHVVGAISLVVLLVATYALYGRRLAGGWRTAYVVTAVLALYLNAFVAVVQLFLKQPPFMALAPTQTEPPFAIAHALTFVFFAGIGFLGQRRFRVA